VVPARPRPGPAGGHRQRHRAAGARAGALRARRAAERRVCRDPRARRPHRGVSRVRAAPAAPAGGARAVAHLRRDAAGADELAAGGARRDRGQRLRPPGRAGGRDPEPRLRPRHLPCAVRRPHADRDGRRQRRPRRPYPLRGRPAGAHTGQHRPRRSRGERPALGRRRLRRRAPRHPARVGRGPVRPHDGRAALPRGRRRLSRPRPGGRAARRPSPRPGTPPPRR
jgi:hypothetical protein